MRAITLTTLVIVTLAAALHGYWRHRLGRNAVVVAFALAAVWLLDVLVVSTRWRHADGFVDCNQNCSGLQQTVGVLFFLAPAAALLLLIAATVTWVVRRRRESRVRKTARPRPD